MIFFLAFMLLCLLIISYVFTGKDIFAPANVMIVTFFAATVGVIYNYSSWKYDISIATFLLIYLAMFGTVIVNASMHKRYSGRPIISSREVIYEIPFHILIIFVCFLAFGVCLHFMRVKSQYSGEGNISTAIYVYRLSNYNGIDAGNTAWYMSQVRNIATAITYTTGINLIYFFNKKKIAYNVLSITCMVLWAVMFLVTGARFEIISMLISLFIISYLVKIRKTGRYNQFSLKSVFMTISYVILILLAFYYLAEIIGRGSDRSIIQYVTKYIGGSIPSLDMYLKKPTYSDFFGQETFYSLMQWLRRRGLINIPYVSFNMEFRSIGTVGIGNIYSAFRHYYHDFGAMGVIVLHLVFSVIFCYIYESTKRRPKFYKIIVVAMTYNCIVFYFMNNTFFGTDCSVSFLIQVIETLVLFKIVMHRKHKQLNKR